jgi:hypothetical protein
VAKTDTFDHGQIGSNNTAVSSNRIFKPISARTDPGVGFLSPQVEARTQPTASRLNHAVAESRWCSRIDAGGLLPQFEPSPSRRGRGIARVRLAQRPPSAAVESIDDTACDPKDHPSTW